MIAVREARPGEYGAVGALTVATFVGEGLVPAESEYVAALGDASGRARAAQLLVAVDEDGEVVGSVTFARAGTPYANLAHGDEAELRMLAVAPAARERGVGRALVLACMEQARSLGHPRLVLSTQEEMRAAQRLYTRLGFARMPQRDWEPVPGLRLLAYSRSGPGCAGL